MPVKMVMADQLSPYVLPSFVLGSGEKGKGEHFGAISI